MRTRPWFAHCLLNRCQSALRMFCFFFGLFWFNVLKGHWTACPTSRVRCEVLGLIGKFESFGDLRSFWEAGPRFNFKELLRCFACPKLILFQWAQHLFEKCRAFKENRFATNAWFACAATLAQLIAAFAVRFCQFFHGSEKHYETLVFAFFAQGCRCFRVIRWGSHPYRPEERHPWNALLIAIDFCWTFVHEMAPAMSQKRTCDVCTFFSEVQFFGRIVLNLSK